jgi:hypothetical protein
MEWDRMDELIVWGLLYAFPLVVWIGAPVFLGLAWWSWVRAPKRRAPSWRAHVLLAGLIAGSVNVVMAWSWLIYRLGAGPRPEVWKLKDTCGDAGIYLILVAMATATFGHGNGRVALLSCAVLGFLMWSNIGVL